RHQHLALGDVVVGELPVLALVHGGDAACEPAHGATSDGTPEGGGPDAHTDGGTDARYDERRGAGDGPGDATHGAPLHRLPGHVADQMGVALTRLGLGGGL